MQNIVIYSTKKIIQPKMDLVVIQNMQQSFNYYISRLTQ